MPGKDGTGPMGQGPMTGRGFGPCVRGFRRGFSRGFGRRWKQWQEPVTLSKEEEKKILEAEIKEIEAEKQKIEMRLKEMGKK